MHTKCNSEYLKRIINFEDLDLEGTVILTAGLKKIGRLYVDWIYLVQDRIY
jgi:hypothetical protein